MICTKTGELCIGHRLPNTSFYTTSCCGAIWCSSGL